MQCGMTAAACTAALQLNDFQQNNKYELRRIVNFINGENAMRVETSTPPHTMVPIGPYSHIAKVGEFITIGATAGVDPETGELAGFDIASQTVQILNAFEVMLKSVNSDLAHILHINIFLVDMADYNAMNDAYARRMGRLRPARTAIAVSAVPKADALITMNLTAVTR